MFQTIVTVVLLPGMRKTCFEPMSMLPALKVTVTVSGFRPRLAMVAFIVADLPKVTVEGTARVLTMTSWSRQEMLQKTPFCCKKGKGWPSPTALINVAFRGPSLERYSAVTPWVFTVNLIVARVVFPVKARSLSKRAAVITIVPPVWLTCRKVNAFCAAD